MGSLGGEVLQVEGITGPKGLGPCWPVGGPVRGQGGRRVLG